MQIISHRGYWTSDSEKNQEVSFSRSFECGFGTETDLRDLDGEVVVSHDMPTKLSATMTFDALLSLHSKGFNHLPLLLNIKSDGLQTSIKELLAKYGTDNYFLFDMSVPDLLTSIRANLKCLTRQSEYEASLSLYDRVDGVWMDEFERDWITAEHLSKHIDQGKLVFIVSPELHGRSYEQRWATYRDMSVTKTDRCVLCTDIPEQATQFFNS